MRPNLSEPLAHLFRPLFQALPINQAMSRLTVPAGEPADGVAIVERILRDEALQGRPELAAGLWLYVDELERSHAVSQAIETPSGAFWHAIMHRREGDFANSHYWYRQTGRHPAMSRIDMAGGGAGAGTTIGGYDPHDFIDRVERAHAQGEDSPELIAMQRHEWMALFEWCVEH